LMLLLWRLLTTKKFIQPRWLNRWLNRYFYPYCIKKKFRTPLRRVPFSLGNSVACRDNVLNVDMETNQADRVVLLLNM
jgi:hypothetical protein